MAKIVCVSGYFDPLHIGHIEYMKKASSLGYNLLVIVNNDHQTKLKKGKSFMPENERLKIISSLKCVDRAVLSIDQDRTVCETLRLYKPDIFANGGDQNNNSIPESGICEELGIELADGLGLKIQSSRWLIKKSNSEQYNEKWING
jgi:cytidyltransferase-like protein